jgi:hypothetical protein
VKKIKSSLIITIVSNILFLILNGAIGFVLSIARDLAFAFSSGNSDTLFVSLMVYSMIISKIFNIVNIIFAIWLIIKVKKSINGMFPKKLLIIHFVIYLISIIINIINIFMLINGIIVIINMFLTIIEIIALILIILGIRSYNKNLHSEEIV